MAFVSALRRLQGPRCGYFFQRGEITHENQQDPHDLRGRHLHRHGGDPAAGMGKVRITERGAYFPLGKKKTGNFWEIRK